MCYLLYVHVSAIFCLYCCHFLFNNMYHFKLKSSTLCIVLCHLVCWFGVKKLIKQHIYHYKILLNIRFEVIVIFIACKAKSKLITDLFIFHINGTGLELKDLHALDIITKLGIFLVSLWWPYIVLNSTLHSSSGNWAKLLEAPQITDVFIITDMHKYYGTHVLGMQQYGQKP